MKSSSITITRECIAHHPEMDGDLAHVRSVTFFSRPRKRSTINNYHSLNYMSNSYLRPTYGTQLTRLIYTTHDRTYTSISPKYSIRRYIRDSYICIICINIQGVLDVARFLSTADTDDNDKRNTISTIFRVTRLFEN